MGRMSVAAVAMLGLVVFLGIAYAGSDTPPNGTWTIHVTPSANNYLEGTNLPYEDDITIKSGKFTSRVNARKGFRTATCTSEEEKGGITLYTAELTSPRNGTLVYKFMIQGEAFKGTLTWTKDTDTPSPKEATWLFDNGAEAGKGGSGGKGGGKGK